ncbi:hypothetical protein [Bacillus mycoides]|uniref:hypothetical protein n=1 Tax=Bacillus mycoides TaxID=1405 RepID=UPI0037F2EE02
MSEIRKAGIPETFSRNNRRIQHEEMGDGDNDFVRYQCISWMHYNSNTCQNQSRKYKENDLDTYLENENGLACNFKKV